MKDREHRTFDPAEYLDSDEALAAFLADALMDAEHPELFPAALAAVVHSRGNVAQTARTAGLSTPELYKILGADSDPKLSTLRALLDVLGVELTIRPKLAH
ncbi:transcriptional regulator [Cupriavidus sp. HPC(L)]|uniref:addiction module antidote protein n=1 Tax=Cupriavidus sp. HPC(L) TaxID=1217418 RepID=UPI0003BFD066|nr:addiction module antidote protein [Cupriavidus sp. HPC(L)]ESJ21399.1 transcriptional regulator [Cupriavidus sp. HPC(L)]